MQDSYAASRLENDIYSFLNVGILLRKKVTENKEVVRYIDQICLFDRVGEENIAQLIVEGGRFVSKEIPVNLRKKFRLENINDPFEQKNVRST